MPKHPKKDALTKDAVEQHRYGQHYTPETVARLLAAFAVRRGSDLVLDPSCGDGRLLKQVISLKGGSQEEDGCGVFGIDRSAAAVQLGRETGAAVVCADFFSVEPGANLSPSFTLPPLFDAIIGNPPYIRQEIMGSGDKTRIRSVLAVNAEANADAGRRGRQKMASLTSKGKMPPARDDNGLSLNGASRVLPDETSPANQQPAP
ncbi:MAG TPA: N-6 DNA methylase, partial [Blastocatellia bacterium]|nr:N-6 DNA methylase [Blastocatellia bacterium]